MSGTPPTSSSEREREIFFTAIEIEQASEREKYLAEACAGDGALLASVGTLLNAACSPDSGLLDADQYPVLREARDNIMVPLAKDDQLLEEWDGVGLPWSFERDIVS